MNLLCSSLGLVSSLLLVSKERVDVAIIGHPVTIRYRIHNPMEYPIDSIKLVDQEYRENVPLIASKETVYLERTIVPAVLGTLEDKPATLTFKTNTGESHTLHSSFKGPLRVITEEAWHQEMESHWLAWTIWWSLAVISILIIPKL